VEVEKLYNILTYQLLCKVVNKSVSKQSNYLPSSLPVLPLEGGEADV
jgi:hypothetical protein